MIVSSCSKTLRRFVNSWARCATHTRRHSLHIAPSARTRTRPHPLFLQIDTLRDRVRFLSLSELVKRVMKEVAFVNRPVDAQDPLLDDELLRAGHKGLSFASGSASAAASASKVSTARSAGSSSQVPAQLNIWTAMVEEAEAFAEEWGEKPSDDAILAAGSEVAARNMMRVAAFVDHLCTSITEAQLPAQPRAGTAKQAASAAAMPVLSAIAKRDAVWLGTVHQAKGLEWKAVFIVHMTDGEMPLLQNDESFMVLTEILVPEVRMNDEADEAEEERRVAYVAMSRDVEELHCTYSARLDFDDAAPSRYLRSIPAPLVSRLYQYASGAPTTKHPHEEDELRCMCWPLTATVTGDIATIAEAGVPHASNAPLVPSWPPSSSGRHSSAVASP